MSKMPARLPPTWRWIVTAVMTKRRFFEPTRSAISASAPSIGRPRRVSVRTRLNSLAAGPAPSSTTAWIPCRKLWPALSDAASVVSTSGSWSSIAARRRLRLEPDDEDRERTAEREGAKDEECRGAADREDEAEQERRAGGGVDELDGAERQVGPLDQAVQPAPEREVAERALGRLHHGRRGLEALLCRPARSARASRRDAARAAVAAGHPPAHGSRSRAPRSTQAPTISESGNAPRSKSQPGSDDFGGPALGTPGASGLGACAGRRRARGARPAGPRSGT